MVDDKWESIHVEDNRTPYSNFLDLFVCPRCSALVKDQEKHNNWHVGAMLFGG